MTSLINVDRYPIHMSESEVGRAFVDQCRERFTQDGLCELPGFVSEDALAQMAAEANAVSSRAHFFTSDHNVYLDDDKMAHRPIATHREQTRVGSVAFDNIPLDAALRSFYEDNLLTQFIGEVVGKTPLYRSADVLGACSINVFKEDGVHGWHFDESEFSITLMLQSPESGGAFEYVPMIRGMTNEDHVITRTVNGSREHVVQLPFTPGTLLIFGGRQTLHRVTDVYGTTPRLVPVLCYSETPNAVNSPEVRQMFWGRTG